MSGHAGLTVRLARLRRFFRVEEIVNKQIDAQDVIRYYKRSRLAYLLIHSRDRAIHMSLSRDGQYNPDGHQAQVELVSREIEDCKAKRVLELGCGGGYNLARLARNWPNAEFMGIDLSSKNVNDTRKEARDLPNVHTRQADFESLPLPDSSFDLIYSVESLCHARNANQALAEANRVVAAGGRLVVIDAWRSSKVIDATPEDKTAVSLIEKSMAVTNTMSIDDWRALCEELSWRPLTEQDLSCAVLPNLERFERLADRLLSRPIVAKVANLIFPRDLMNNVVAGYLMAQSVRQGFHSYGLVVLKKEQ